MEVRTTALGSYEHQHALREALKSSTARDTSRSPLFQVFVLQNDLRAAEDRGPERTLTFSPFLG